MKRLLVLGVLLVVGVELLVLLAHQRQLLLWVSGGAMALLVLGVRRLLGGDTDLAADEENAQTTGDALSRWMAGTETRVRWAESTRRDWDRHWRPVLARRFEMTTGHRHAKDSGAFNETGRMLFGAQLWQWVDPANVAHTGGREPGPGRAVLEEILQRLEQR